jgi:hypothetical protein
MNIENPSSLPLAEKDNGEKKKKTGLTKTLITAGLVTLAGVVAAGAETPEGDNKGKGNTDTTQATSIKKSHERPGIQSMGFDKAPTFDSETSGSSDVDFLLTKTESSGAGYSIKKKDLTKTGYIADTDTQNRGKSFQTTQGNRVEVERKYAQLKKQNKGKNRTLISFNDGNR